MTPYAPVGAKKGGRVAASRGISEADDLWSPMRAIETTEKTYFLGGACTIFFCPEAGVSTICFDAV